MDIDEAFRSGEIHKVSDDDLEGFLVRLCTTPNMGDVARHTSLVKAITINHIQTARTFERIDRQNARTQRLVVRLSVMTLVVGVTTLVVGVTQVIVAVLFR